jgi:Raf kinase inhibitor-like YbhB/YbcL family protein
MRIVLLVGVCLVAAGCISSGGYEEVEKMGDMTLSSPAFTDGSSMPAEYTCDGDDVNPPLSIMGVPEGVVSLVLIVDDPDAPMGTWDHWVVWNIAVQTTVIPAGSVPAGAVEGLNDFRKRAYGGPCPPSGTHRYFFKLYALDVSLDLKPESRKEDVEEAMVGHILAQTQLVGTYGRK